ncbi:DNA helicase II [Alkalicella caledoniensis]|uniref:DNA helicase II n=1 Tax=Alkalicella caledoniensis TaxID=2731377 RepID=A0A7G9W5W8_ALKCA|nr:RQC-minor-1 family DNA-binding protein [Alkalicella caledoniensis]QNO14080.1 DNA helicase II [Alkalicella caledoniensis]
MSRRQPRVRYELSDIKGVNPPSDKEIKVILRAADEIIYTGGRAMLAKILKGSKDKNILEHRLQDCPSYGFYSSKTIAEVTQLVDWMIINRYLEIDYNGRLPMIVFSKMGWELYKPVYAEELYENIVKVNANDDTDMLVEQLKKTNRQVVLILLDKISESKNIGVIRFLENWKETEVKKVRAGINKAIKMIKS